MSFLYENKDLQWIILDLIRESMVVGFIVFLLLPYVWNKISGVKILSLAPKSYSFDEGKMLCRHDWFIQYWMTVTYAEAPKGTVITWGSQGGPHIPWALQRIAGPGMIPVRFSGSQSGTIRWPSLGSPMITVQYQLSSYTKPGMPEGAIQGYQGDLNLESLQRRCQKWDTTELLC